MLTRRGFLGVLLAGTGAMVVKPDWLWQPSIDAGLPTLAPEAVLSVMQMTKAIVAEMVTQLDPMTGVAGWKVGHERLQHQWNVSCDLPDVVDHQGYDTERYINPIASSLAHAMRVEETRYCGRLEIPASVYGQGAVVTNAAHGLSVRGLAFYDVGDLYRDPHWLMRFDVVGGA